MSQLASLSKTDSSSSILTDSLYNLGIQTQYNSTLNCWLQSVLALTHANKVICFLLTPEGTHLTKVASTNGEQVIVETNPARLSGTDYDDANALTLCLTEGRNFDFKFSQCNDTLRHILFTADERYQLTEGQINLIPLRTPDNNSVIGVLAMYMPNVYTATRLNKDLNTLNHLAICKISMIRSLSAKSLNKPRLKKVNSPIPENYGMIGQSKAIKAVHLKISQALHINQNILVTGETGTGKELIAKAIYLYGNRRNEVFCVQNCASIPEQLLESELFGYKKGAFTGADRDYDGLLRSAQNGTLFLDEIGDMPIQLQAKLLRVLEDKKVRPLGSAISYPINVRIVAATHQNLEEHIQNGLFRRDLYYRLAQFPIDLPPLHLREKDAALLANFFIQQYAKENDISISELSNHCAQTLSTHRFLGNVRELKNIIERTLIMSSDPSSVCPHILAKELSSSLPKIKANPASEQFNVEKIDGSLSTQIEQFEKQLLTHYLDKYQGQLQTVAQQLQLSKGSLDYRMRKFNLSAKEWRHQS